MLFGVEQRLKSVDKVREYLEEQLEDNVRDLESVRDRASDLILKSQEYNKRYIDQKRKEPHKYAEGDYVMIRNFDSSPGVSHKLIPQFRGPYEVVKVLRNNRYVVADVDGFQVTQKPYQGVWEPANMRPWLPNNKGATPLEISESD